MNHIAGGVLLSNKHVSADQGIRVSWTWYNLSTGTVKWTFRNDYTEERSFILFRNGYYFGNAFWCFKPDEIILGDNKKASEYRPGDSVLGRKGLVKVISAGRRWSDGDLIRIKAEGMLPLEVTPNHLILTTLNPPSEKNNIMEHSEELRYVEAFKLERKKKNGTGNYLVVPSPEGTLKMRTIIAALKVKDGSRYKTIQIPLNEDTSWLLGIYCAYGHVYHSKDSILNFFMKSEKEGTYGRVGKILEGLGLKAEYSLNEEGKIFGIKTNSEFLEILEISAGNSVHGKFIPDFILYHKSRSILTAFIRGLMTDNPYFTGKSNTSSSFSTSHRVLAEQLQLAWIRLGRFAAIYWTRKRNSSGHGKGNLWNEHYRVRLFANTNSNGRGVKFAGNYLYTPIKSIKKIPYKGWVYDLKTEDESIVAANVVTHNCVYLANKGFNTTFATKLTPLVNNGVEKNSPPLVIVDLGGKYIVAFLFTLSPGQTWSMLEGGFSENSPPSNYSGISVKLTGPKDFCVGYDEQQVTDWDLQTNTQLTGYYPNPSTFISLLAHSSSSFVSLFSDQIKEGKCND